VPLSPSSAAKPAKQGIRLPQPCRVLLVLTGISTDGGAEVQTVELAVRLKRRGWDVSLVSMLPIEAVPPVLTSAGIAVESVNIRSGMDAAAGLVRLAGIFRRRRPQIVHSHMTHAVLAARLARVGARVPVVIGTLHGLHMYNVSGGGHRLRELMHRATDGLSDLTTVVCDAALEYYRETKAAPARKIRLVVNGVDCQRFRPDPALRAAVRADLQLGGEFVWLSVARLDPVKDHNTLLRAFALVAKAQTGSVLLVVGGGGLLKELETLADELGVGAQVRFLGSRRDVAELWNAADAGVLTLRFEALPLTLLEAGASGLPVVATNVGGCSMVVAEGQTGLLAPVGDCRALAEAMLRIERMGELDRLCMGTAARERVLTHYSFESVVEQWEEIYRSMLMVKGDKV
jgi:glycosyltransferase involved in cell wall biosynthesis